MRGDCEVDTENDALRVTSRESGELHVLGLEIQLDAGDEVVVSSLTPVAPSAPEPNEQP